MTKFQDSQWAQWVESEFGDSRPNPTDAHDTPPVARQPGAEAKRRLAARNGRSLYDSSWDLRQGVDIEELQELPPEFRDTEAGSIDPL